MTNAGDNGRVRPEPSILHVDLDAFFAAVEQRDKPSLRGKPVIVGGVGRRGVVATASYEARRYGVRSAMSMAEARSRCPSAAFLSGRFPAYRETSVAVMALLRRISPLVEPVSLDEAFVDLRAAVAVAVGVGVDASDVAVLTALGRRLKDEVAEVTGGLLCSVGIASSKLLAKIASELDKPDGLVVVPPGTEQDLLRPMDVSALPGVGPATAQRLRRAGLHTVGELGRVSEEELVGLVGSAHGSSLCRLARADDDRPVVAERETKSVSVEDTYDADLVDRRLLEGLLDRQAAKVAKRLHDARLSGRTVVVKVRLHDFSTHTKSSTLVSPTDSGRVVARQARRLLAEMDTSGGVRLLGVGVSGLSDWVQEDLFTEYDAEPEPSTSQTDALDAITRRRRWAPGADVVHSVHGPGWVWGSGLGRVTVRFETARTPPGPVHTFSAEDPDLRERPVDDAGEAEGCSSAEETTNHTGSPGRS